MKIKLHRDSTSQKLGLYELKVALFYNGETEDFFFFIRNFNMTRKASETLVTSANIQYLSTMVRE